MTTVLLIRHGETDANRTGIMAGRMPGVPLNARGRAQAASVAAALAKAPIKTIYTSPIERAQETASFLARILNLPVQTASGITETDIGDWTGRSVKQCSRLKLWDTVINRPGELTFPGGESFAGIQQRASAEVKAIAERHPGELIACFTHADVIRLIAAYFLDMPLNSFQRIGSDNCSITTIHFGKEGRVFVPQVNLITGFTWPDPPPPPKKPAK